jgi:hypothetical protein
MDSFFYFLSSKKSEPAEKNKKKERRGKSRKYVPCPTAVKETFGLLNGKTIDKEDLSPHRVVFLPPGYKTSESKTDTHTSVCTLQ